MPASPSTPGRSPLLPLAAFLILALAAAMMIPRSPEKPAPSTGAKATERPLPSTAESPAAPTTARIVDAPAPAADVTASSPHPAKSADRGTLPPARVRETETAITTPAPAPEPVRSGPMGIVNRQVEAARLQPGSWHAEIEKAAAANGTAARLPTVYQADPQKLREDFPDAPPQMIAEIQKAFEQSAGVGELDPASPEYLQRWRQAALTTTIRMRTLYGWGANSEMQRQAVLEEMARQMPNAE